MTCQDEVIRIGKKLEKMISSKNVDETASFELLNVLKKQPMTLQVLQKTRIGMTVNTLRKQCHNDEVVLLAKTLIKGWKKLLPGTAGVGGGEPSTSVSSRVDDDDSSRESQPPADNASHKSDSSRDSETTSSTAPVTTTTATKVSFTADVIRIKCREMLANALSTPCEVEGVGDIEAIAAATEDCIFNEFKNTEVKYKNRIRSRVANLKDTRNPRLRENVLLGIIAPSRLAVMTPHEMASDEMKDLRAKLTKEAIDDHQMAQQGGTKSDLFKCGRCGHRDTTYNQVQTRSADEPMTTFVLCNNCGNRWKFC